MTELFRITSDTDFLRIFELPQVYPTDYLFDGGKPVSFLMLDWFQVFSGTSLPIAIGGEEYEKKKDEIIACIQEKPYYNSLSKYLVLTDWDDAFII